MSEHKVELVPPMSASSREELARRIFFVSEYIVDFDIPVTDGLVDTIGLTLTSDERLAEIAADIRATVAELENRTSISQKVLWESAHTKLLHHNVFDHLVERGDAIEVGDGRVAFGERIIALLDYFDTALRSIAVETFGAVEYRYPTLISSRALEAAGYFKSFPQFMMFVTRLHSDFSNYRDFQSTQEDRADIHQDILNYCSNVDLCLPPTMCYHTYAQHQGTRFAIGEHRVVTSDPRTAVGLHRPRDRLHGLTRLRVGGTLTVHAALDRLLFGAWSRGSLRGGERPILLLDRCRVEGFFPAPHGIEVRTSTRYGTPPQYCRRVLQFPPRSFRLVF
jgi:hypothetical protein